MVDQLSQKMYIPVLNEGFELSLGTYKVSISKIVCYAAIHVPCCKIRRYDLPEFVYSNTRDAGEWVADGYTGDVGPGLEDAFHNHILPRR